MTSLEACVYAIYLALYDDKAMIVWRLEYQLITLPYRI